MKMSVLSEKHQFKKIIKAKLVRKNELETLIKSYGWSGCRLYSLVS